MFCVADVLDLILIVCSDMVVYEKLLIVSVRLGLNNLLPNETY